MTNFKTSKRLLIILWVCALSCRSKEPLPVDTWSQACVQLSPDPKGFRLTGMCCAYLLLPPLQFDSNRRFSLNAEYFAFTGAGFASQPVLVNGELSGNGQTLTISYPIGSALTTYELKPGAATIMCTCGCD